MVPSQASKPPVRLDGFLDALFLLKEATLERLKDAEFGDSEFEWTDKNGESVAWGYNGIDGCDVSVTLTDGSVVVFTGHAAKVLTRVYDTREVQRNDVSNRRAA